MTRRAFLLGLLLPQAFRPAPRVDDRLRYVAKLLQDAANGKADPWALAEAAAGIKSGRWGRLEIGR